MVELCARVNCDPQHRRRPHPSLGLHPEKADLAALKDMLELIDTHADDIACVGDVGLDYSRHLSAPD